MTSAGSATTLSWGDLDREARRSARALAEHGASAEALVAVDLPHGPQHVAAAYGAWKLGATVLPINAAAPEPELRAILALANEYRPVVRASTVLERVANDPVTRHPASLDDPAPVACPSHLIASGGSTGRPKLINPGVPAVVTLRGDQPALAGDLAHAGLRPGQVHLICTPLHHTSGFAWLHNFLMLGDPVVLLERFDPRVVLDTVEQCAINQVILVPATMQRLASQPDIDRRDLSSLEVIWHGGAVCPPGLKRRWIELLGPTRVWESFGPTEGNGGTLIRGDEWLLHPGSVGRPITHELRILGEDGQDLPAGEVGELYFRPLARDKPQFRYIGPDRPRTTPDGFSSVGDLGWRDEDGYLYIADRRTDMIISGGANVFAAEVEAVLLDCPEVADAVVIGLPDAAWGRRVHAICVPAQPGRPASSEMLKTWCRLHLAAYKVPKSFEMVEIIPRSDAGKVRRAQLVSERCGMDAS